MVAVVNQVGCWLKLKAKKNQCALLLTTLDQVTLTTKLPLLILLTNLPIMKDKMRLRRIMDILPTNFKVLMVCSVKMQRLLISSELMRMHLESQLTSLKVQTQKARARLQISLSTQLRVDANSSSLRMVNLLSKRTQHVLLPIITSLIMPTTLEKRAQTTQLESLAKVIT